MKITVFSGSPKGELSISLQYLNYAAAAVKTAEFEIFHIGERISLIENNAEEIEKISKSLSESEGVIWVFPVYHFLVPAQLKRFVEILDEKGVKRHLSGKYSTSIISSIHFYDTMAESYINGVSEDFGMKYIKGFTAGMEDLYSERGQIMVEQFMRRFIEDTASKKNVTKMFSLNINEKITPCRIEEEKKEKTNKYKITLITDTKNRESNISNMINRFINKLPNNIEVINLNEIETKGGCMGCCRCAYDGICVYNDEMASFLSQQFINSDALIIAGEIKNRYLGYKIKQMWDRSFVYGHRAVRKGQKMVYLLSGVLSSNSILKDEIEARCSVGHTPLVDIVCDEQEYIESHIDEAAVRVMKALDEDIAVGENFYSVSGQKIFRDFIYKMRYVFIEDHKFYKTTQVYDFPQKDFGARGRNTILSLLLKLKPVREEFKKRTKFEMVKSLKRIVEIKSLKDN